MHPRRYETLILLSPDLAPPALQTFREKVEGILADGGAKIVRYEDWGRRTLAYPVSKQLHGQYVIYDYQGLPAVEAELKRNLKIHESVFKHLTLVLDHKFTDLRYEAEKARLLAKSLKKEADEKARAAAEESRENRDESHEGRDRDGGRDRDRDRDGGRDRDRDGRGGRDRDRDGRGGRDRDRDRDRDQRPRISEAAPRAPRPAAPEGEPGSEAKAPETAPAAEEKAPETAPPAEEKAPEAAPAEEKAPEGEPGSEG
ncbi:MAG: 30S ribosomal protein S6 [Deltaproteobacteria bacterium]|jgi:ribosomal protein S6|nr:30S ribosomal protein S6 [Deltaproteobacteria bacterium]